MTKVLLTIGALSFGVAWWAFHPPCPSCARNFNTFWAVWQNHPHFECPHCGYREGR